MSRTAARRMTVADLAKQEGVSERTVRRRLNKLDVANGGQIVLRNSPGNARSPMYVTVASLARADRRLVEEKRVLAEEVADLKKSDAEKARTIRSLKAALREVREFCELLLELVESRTTEVKRGRRVRKV